MKEQNKITPADFFVCPVCRGMVEESWCGTCKAHVIINWGPLHVPGEPRQTVEK